jgi:hypothetical protein
VSGWRLLALTTVSTALLAATLVAPVARADGDPASDVLLSQDVFLPQGQTTPAELADRLNTLTREAGQAGNPIKVALIAAPTDLGSVSTLYGQPEKYARFLSLEIEFVTKAPVLVVMPQGIGFARAGKSIPTNHLAGVTVGSGPQALAQTAIAAISRLEPNLQPAPPPKSHVNVQPSPPPPVSNPPAPTQAAPVPENGSALHGATQPSDSLAEVIADRFETGAGNPIVWAALAITVALVGFGAFGAYLATTWTTRRRPRR